MSPMPTLTIRLRDEHHQVVRDIAARLKTEPAFADALRTLIGQPASAEAVSDLPDLRDLVRRLEAVERALEGRTVAPAPTLTPEPPAAVQPQQNAAAAPPQADTAASVKSEAPPAEEKRPYKRATDAEKAEIRRRRAAGEKAEVIARAFGVSVATVNRYIAEGQG